MKKNRNSPPLEPDTKKSLKVHARRLFTERYHSVDTFPEPHNNSDPASVELRRRKKEKVKFSPNGRFFFFFFICFLFFLKSPPSLHFLLRLLLCLSSSSVSWGHSFATVIPGFAIHIHPKASACTEMALQQPLESRSFFFFAMN